LTQDTLNEETNAIAQQSGFPSHAAMMDYYRTKGIPSIVLAVVTVILAAYSFWVVQPNIQDQYRRICNANFEKLGLVNVGSMSLVMGSGADSGRVVEGTKPGASALGSGILVGERKKLLVDTQLCLRRLAIMDQASDSIRFESAMVSEALAGWYRERAWEAAEIDPRSNEIGSLLAGERNEIGKAMDAMKSVQRLKGPYASRASLWMLEKQLRQAGDDVKELAELEASVREMDGVETVLGRILAMRALRFGAENAPAASAVGSGKAGLGKASSGDRMSMLKEAVELLEHEGSDELELDSWRALAKLPLDSQSAQDLAWGAVQDFWSRKSSDRPHAEELDAVFRGLLVGGNLEEAQSFIVNQLKKLPVFEQTMFRQLVAASCLRQIVADCLSELHDRANVARMKNDYTLLDLAVRLQPEVDGLQEVIVAIGSSDSKESDVTLVNYVRRLIATSERDGLSGICDAVIAAKSGDDAAITKAIERVCQDDMAYGVLATKVAMSLVIDDSNREAAIVWLKAMNEYSPDVLAAWFARGNLHLKAEGNSSEKEQAIECFKYLAKRIPDNEQVKELLDEARK